LKKKRNWRNLKWDRELETKKKQGKERRRNIQVVALREEGREMRRVWEEEV